ncbi:MAG: UxaA family hydrolase, partial [Desulfobacteraceae bacterium]|nr:UxaA family hydrolase [Desulfobacteraceae bacterium]
TITKGRYRKGLKDLGLLTIRVGEKDNVLTALADIKRGEYLLNGKVMFVPKKVHRGFKMAAVTIKQGAKIYKYNYPIGLAGTDIKPGSLVHVHNVISAFNE